VNCSMRGVEGLEWNGLVAKRLMKILGRKE